MLGAGLQLTLLIGPMVASPAPASVMEALESVEVTRSDEGSLAFQLQFHADRATGFSADFDLLAGNRFAAGNRVVIIVTVQGVQTVIMDGLITAHELAHTRESGASLLTVTGEDLSVAMDLMEYSLEYPAMGDAMIAELVLAKYMALGILPEVIPTPSSLISLPIEQVPQQNGTDRNYLRQLAQTHGYVFYLKPGPLPMMNTAYWGPPIRFGTPQKALTVDMGPATNVESIQFQANALAPELVHGLVQDTETELDVPVATFASLRFPPLASEPAVMANQPFVRNTLFTDPRLGIVRALDYAQTATDVSTDKVVVGNGELDVLRYGAVLDAPGLVAVRGVGLSHDGLYYVQSVTHKISRGSYKQQFTLTREGLGSTIPAVIP